MLGAVDPICPLLTLGSDRHAVCGGFDADHRCSVPDGPDPLGHSQQQRYCLGPTHVECPHYARNELASGMPRIEGVPPPSADVLLAPTRLVIDPDVRLLRVVQRRTIPGRARPVLAAAVVVVAMSAGVASGTWQGLAALAGSAGDPLHPDAGVPVPTATSTRTPGTPTIAATPSVAPTSVPTPKPSVDAPPSASPASEPTSDVMPAQTYVVQPGDTLKSIADRYGTTVVALQAANGIADQNVINVGQVLTIP